MVGLVKGCIYMTVNMESLLIFVNLLEGMHPS